LATVVTPPHTPFNYHLPRATLKRNQVKIQEANSRIISLLIHYSEKKGIKKKFLTALLFLFFNLNKYPAHPPPTKISLLPHHPAHPWLDPYPKTK
jgi:hypothetical protein